MTSFLNKFKSLAIGVMVILFFLGISLSSCGSKESGESTDNVEAATDGEEHPAEGGEEHPTEDEEGDDEHPEGEEEHPEEDEEEK
jgi:hypothetical protein